MKEYILNFIKYQLHEHCGRTIGVILGFIISLAILIFGLFTTLFVIICMGIGLYVGNLIDKDDEFSDNILYKIQKNLTTLFTSLVKGASFLYESQTSERNRITVIISIRF